MSDAQPRAGEIGEFLRCDVFAVAGVSAREDKFGTIAYRDLVRAGKRVYGLNPRLAQLDGGPIYARLADLPETPDVLTLVVPSVVGMELVKEAARLGVRRVWMQPGAESLELLSLCAALNLEVVHSQCVMVQLAARASHGGGA